MYVVAGNPKDHGGFSDKQLLETPHQQLYQQLARLDDATRARVEEHLHLLRNRICARRSRIKHDLKAATLVETNLDLQSKANALTAKNAALHKEGEVIMQKEMRARQELLAHSQIVPAMKWQIGQLLAILTGGVGLEEEQ
jgi:hypothetical protein